MSKRQIYVGTKKVYPTAMTRAEYYLKLELRVPLNEDATEKGYMVEYLEGGKPNTSFSNMYVSWSPKDVFDKSYFVEKDKKTAEILLRLNLELKELVSKYDALTLFLDSPQATTIPSVQLKLLTIQEPVMSAYISILQLRIELIEKSENS